MNTLTRFLKVVAVLLLTLILACSYSPRVYAEANSRTEQLGSLKITRIAPQTARVGQKLWVVIQVENLSAEEAEFRLIERLGDADFDQTQAKSTQIYDPGYGALPSPNHQAGFDLWYYEWHVKIPAGQKTDMAYWLVPHRAGIYVISPAQIVMGDKNYKTASWMITVKCVVDGACQLSAGENHQTCADDCLSGAADNVCDGVLDGRLDPDCEAGYDPDAGASSLPAVAPSPTAPAGRQISWNVLLLIAAGGAGTVILLVLLVVLIGRLAKKR